MLKINSLLQGPIEWYTWNFPGGEIGVKISTEIKCTKDSYVISWTGVPTFNELMVLAQLVDALRTIDIKSRITLSMPYLPYARQDRVCHTGESFALVVFMKFLKTIKFDQIRVCDIHSTVGLQLLENIGVELIVENQFNIAASLIDKYDVIISPDTGAQMKLKTQGIVYGNKQLLSLTKTRSDGTVKYEPITEDLSGKKCLVVDDICDGGATFIALAQALKVKPMQLDLYVTHGIFSRGLDTLETFYHNIYCYNNMNNIEGVKSV